MNNEKKILLFSVLTLIVTMSSLAWIERSQSDFAEGKNWWAISFVHPSPQSDDLTFTIENFSDDEIFTYQIISDDAQSQVLSETIPKGTSKIISVQELAPAQIVVTANAQTKSINK